MENKKLQALLKEATDVYNQVQQEVNSFKTETYSLLEGFATRAKATYDRFKALEKENNEYNALLLGNEMRGRTTDPATIKKASDCETEYNKIKSALGALGAMAALAVCHIQKQVNELSIKHREAEINLTGFESYVGDIAKAYDQGKVRADIKAEIARRKELTIKFKAELDSKTEALEVLKELAAGKTAAPDGGTLAGAQAVITAAAKAYNVRQKIGEQILEEIETIKEEEENLKQRKAMAYDMLSSTGCELIHYLIVPVMPFINTELFNNPSGEANNVANLLVKRRARELEINN